MKPATTIFSAILLSVIAAYATVKLTAPPVVAENGKIIAPATAAKHESAYERVMRTRTIRCGYALWAALIEKDPNTGKLSGIFPDYMEALGQATGLKIEWTAELGFGDFITALDTSRIDVMCSGTWTNAKRGMNVQFITPISYQGVVAWVREGDTRFDNNLAAINEPSVKVLAVDGASSHEIAETFYPRAELVSLPQLTAAAEALMNVVDKKADVVFTDHFTASQFLKTNPGTLRAVPAAYPVKLFGNPLAIRMNEPALKALLDNATMELMNTGVIERILQKYETVPGTFYRAALSYVPNNEEK